MELSCKIEYALLALIELTGRYEQQEPLQIKYIASLQKIPDRYLEQLLATLRRGGLLVSHRGAKGGYMLAKEPWKIKLMDVIDCLQGTETQSVKKDMVVPTAESSVIQEVWQELEYSIKEVLERYTLQDLRDRRDSKKQLNFMYYI